MTDSSSRCPPRDPSGSWRRIGLCSAGVPCRGVRVCRYSGLAPPSVGNPRNDALKDCIPYAVDTRHGDPESRPCQEPAPHIPAVVEFAARTISPARNLNECTGARPPPSRRAYSGRVRPSTIATLVALIEGGLHPMAGRPADVTGTG